MTGLDEARRELGVRLRALRREKGLQGKELAALLGWPASKVSRLENARQTAIASDVMAWAEAVSATPEELEELRALVEKVSDRQGDMRQRMGGSLSSLQGDVHELELESTVVRAFEPSIIMGLLQTAEYARHIFSMVRRIYGGENDVAEGVQARMRRQEILYDPDRRFHLIVSEAALRHKLAPPEVMKGQMDRLIAITSLESVEFGIVPFDVVPPFAFLHGFWMYDDSLVTVETKTRELHLRGPEDIAFYLRMFEELRKVARFGEEGRAVIAQQLLA